MQVLRPDGTSCLGIPSAAPTHHVRKMRRRRRPGGTRDDGLLPQGILPPGITPTAAEQLVSIAAGEGGARGGGGGGGWAEGRGDGGGPLDDPPPPPPLPPRSPAAAMDGRWPSTLLFSGTRFAGVGEGWQDGAQEGGGAGSAGGGGGEGEGEGERSDLGREHGYETRRRLSTAFYFAAVINLVATTCFFYNAWASAAASAATAAADAAAASAADAASASPLSSRSSPSSPPAPSAARTSTLVPWGDPNNPNGNLVAQLVVIIALTVEGVASVARRNVWGMAVYIALLTANAVVGIIFAELFITAFRPLFDVPMFYLATLLRRHCSPSWMVVHNHNHNLAQITHGQR